MGRVIAFDVNVTLLDLGAPDPYFKRAFGSAAVREQWFGQMLQLAFVARPGKVPSPLAGAPEVIAPDLREVAVRIVAIDA
jgi:hypothetical protein